MPGLGRRREELQVQDRQKLIVKGSADDHHLIQDDITSVKPVPVELKWSMGEEEFNEYDKVASGIIRDNQEFQEESLRRYLKKNNIPVYSLKDVTMLLKYKNRNQNNPFVFLTESERNEEVYGHSCQSQFGGLLVSKQVFCGFVPLRVIARISLILSNFPELCCFVSLDSNSSCSEVFVAVTFGKNSCSEMFVVDMWNKDEPSVARREE